MLYARAPRLGAVKTRLTPWLGRKEALALHLALLEDSLRLLRFAAAASGARPFLATSEPWAPGTGRGRRSLVRAASGLARIPQSRGDLGVRLQGTFRDLLERGHDRVVIFGSDSPTLPPAYLEEAVARLSDRDIVLGPAEDGGFYLIGARRVVPGMLAGVPWGTSRVLQEALRLIERGGLHAFVLPRWYDVDLPEDLRRIRADLRRAGGVPPERTAAFLEKLVRRGRL